MPRRTSAHLALLSTLALAPVALAADAPDPEAANRVVEYYYSDAGDPLLMELELCSGIYEEGPDKNECLETLDPKAIERGSEVYVWMKFLVPRDAQAEILTQLNRNGVTRRTFNRTLDGAIRYRTWHVAQFDSAGSWEIAVYHEGVDDVRLLRTVSIEVK